MQLLIVISCYLAFFALGVLFAQRWLVTPAPGVERYPVGLRTVALLLVCWAGMFAAAFLARQIGWLYAEKVSKAEWSEVSYEMMHDGTGDHAFVLLFGWTAGFICRAVAGMLPQGKAAPN